MKFILIANTNLEGITKSVIYPLTRASRIDVNTILRDPEGSVMCKVTFHFDGDCERIIMLNEKEYESFIDFIKSRDGGLHTIHWLVP